MTKSEVLKEIGSQFGLLRYDMTRDMADESAFDVLAEMERKLREITRRERPVETVTPVEAPADFIGLGGVGRA